MGLTVDFGKNNDTMKLMCTNKQCVGVLVKKLQKGISALEINGLGPSNVEKLSRSGIIHSYDLFDKTIFNEELLIKSGNFKMGKALDKILNAVASVKEIPIKNAILSCQFDDIGETFSEKIGMIISGLKPDLTGLLTVVRGDLDRGEDSLIKKQISEAISKFESNGVKVKLYEPPKEIVAKKVEKRVSVSDASIISDIEFLNWEIVDIHDNTVDFHICLDKNTVNKSIKDNNIKIMTLKQICLIFK